MRKLSKIDIIMIGVFTTLFIIAILIMTNNLPFIQLESEEEKLETMRQDCYKKNMKFIIDLDITGEKKTGRCAENEPDVTDCIKTVDMTSGCYEVFGYYDERFEEYEWEIQVGGIWRVQTSEPHLPTPEKLCEGGITLGVDNCMEYVILKEIRQLHNETKVKLN